MGTEALVIGALALAAAGTATSIVAATNRPKTPKPTPAPTGAAVPDLAAADEKAKAEEINRRKKRISKAKTILTGPQGVTEDPSLAGKTLLGE